MQMQIAFAKERQNFLEMNGSGISDSKMVEWKTLVIYSHEKYSYKQKLKQGGQ